MEAVEAVLEEKLEKVSRAGRLPDFLVVGHMTGQSADMKEISALALRHGVGGC